MSHQHTISRGPYFPVRPNGSLPPSIADEYRAGATLTELADRHETYLGRVTAELMALGVEMRRKGPKEPANARQRLQEIIALREEGVSPRQIGVRFGISRQRVCQLLDPEFNARRAHRDAGKKAKGTR